MKSCSPVKSTVLCPLSMILALFFTFMTVAGTEARAMSGGDSSLFAQSSEDYDGEYVPENTEDGDDDNQYNPDDYTEETPQEGDYEEYPVEEN